MRIRHGRTLAVLWILAVLATGCDEVPLAPLAAALGPSASPAATATPAVSPSPDVSPTPTASPSVTPDPTPSPSPTPSASPTPNPTPTPAPTPTPPGTLVAGTSPEARGAWTSVTAMARPRMGHGALVLNNRLVVSGGFPTEVLEGYQPSNDTWSEQDFTAAYTEAKRQLILGQYFSCGGAIGTNRFVVAGGFDGSSEIYPPRVYTLTEAFQFSVTFGASLPTPRYAVAGATIGNKLYVAGGSRSRSVYLEGVFHSTLTSNALEAYDVTSNAWTTLANLPVAVSGATAVALNGQLCVLGGLLASGDPTSEVQVFRPDINQWVSDPNLGAIPALKVARHSAAAAVLDGKIYVFGGMTEGRVVTTDCEVYDPATRKWQTLPPMPFARYLHAAAALGGKVFVLGGNNAQGQSQRTVEAFMP